MGHINQSASRCLAKDGWWRFNLENPTVEMKGSIFEKKT
jgi:hypothetical protein